MPQINDRQQLILNLLAQNGPTSTATIKKNLEKNLTKSIARVTIIRDLDVLLKNKLITKIGLGRNTTYQIKETNKLLRFFAPEKYFLKDTDEREIKYPHFNSDVYKNLKKLLLSEELEALNNLNQQYLGKLAESSPEKIKKETERLAIELAWKSAKIEGNTYSLLDTEILIKENHEAKGHNKEEAIMLLNHKHALDYIFNNSKVFKQITLREIENLHAILLKGLGVEKGLRKNVVGIIGTNYRPLDNQYQIREAMEKTIAIINQTKHPLVKALIASLMIAYIQPFMDGNKRTSRLLNNAILIAGKFCPLSFRSINENDYKKAVILFYEQNSALFFKQLFIEQFKFSVDNYFLV